MYKAQRNHWGGTDYLYKKKGKSNTRHLEFAGLIGKELSSSQEEEWTICKGKGYGVSTVSCIHGTLRCMVLPEH